MIRLVVSGGQSGADLGGWKAARRAGLPTCGYMPAGFMTEDGPRPEYAEAYGAEEIPGATGAGGYATRRFANARVADVSLLFGDASSPGSRGLLSDCEKLNKPILHVAPGVKPRDVVTWLKTRSRAEVVNVAGNRESGSPGIGEKVERFLTTVFRILREPAEVRKAVQKPAEAEGDERDVE